MSIVRLFGWLNRNDGAVIAIATVVIAILAGFQFWALREANRANRATQRAFVVEEVEAA